MNLEDFISTQEICIRYKVERRFIRSLSESGLLKIIRIEQTEYIPYDEMSEFEKLCRLHYELDINLEGLEAIQHLLQQVNELQQQNHRLKNRLELYE